MVERTDEIEPAGEDLRARIAELVGLLEERTGAAERFDLQARTAELVETRQLLAERTDALERTGEDPPSDCSNSCAFR